MKFAANLGFLFLRDAPTIVDRISLAAAAGFKGVEYAYPYSIPAETLASAVKNANVEQVLINSWPGDIDHGELGIATDPARCQEFRETLESSIEYLKVLNCKRLHILAGKVVPSTDVHSITEEVREQTFITNIRFAAERLEQEGVRALIEPINRRSVPNYWLCDPDKAVRIIRKVAHPNLQLQFDVFHAQIVGGDLTQRIRDFMPLIGHVQIAQVPNRDEPDSPGEIDYQYVLWSLEECGYNGWVGLEYQPRAATIDGLHWLKDWGYVL